MALHDSDFEIILICHVQDGFLQCFRQSEVVVDRDEYI